MITYSAINLKGQVTIPASTRKKMGIKPQDRVMLVDEGDKLVVRPIPDIFSLKGTIKAVRPLNVKKMREEFETYYGTRKTK